MPIERRARRPRGQTRASSLCPPRLSSSSVTHSLTLASGVEIPLAAPFLKSSSICCVLSRGQIGPRRDLTRLPHSSRGLLSGWRTSSSRRSLTARWTSRNAWGSAKKCGPLLYNFSSFFLRWSQNLANRAEKGAFSFVFRSKSLILGREKRGEERGESVKWVFEMAQKMAAKESLNTRKGP